MHPPGDTTDWSDDAGLCAGLCAGLSRTQLERLADPQWKESNVKISRRDLSVVLSQVSIACKIDTTIVHVCMYCRVVLYDVMVV